MDSVLKATPESVTCRCNNQAVVFALASRSSCNTEIIHLLFFIEAHRQFILRCVHLLGAKNTVTDALSRNKLSS